MSPEMRISDAERDAAVSALGEHYAAGRLTKQEYDERAEQAWAAKTTSQLRPLFADLPSSRTGRAAGSDTAGDRQSSPRRPAGRGGPPWRAIPVLPIVLVVLGVVLLTHIWPLLLIVGVLWLVFGRHRHWGGRHWGSYSRRW
ncbi:MAG TPA: DUF1707 domain-containing protein [Nocardioidaceae bacterium]|nr:DUF1707 domain-containing protein [Nocardioidaceae bacterium]